MKIRKLVRKGLLTLTMCSMMVLVAGCGKDKTNNIDDEIIVSPVMTPSVEATPTITPTPILMTPAPGVTMTPTPEPTPSPVPSLTKAEADSKIKEKIDTSIYSYKLLDEDLNIDGSTYYHYVITDQGTELQPHLLVEHMSGTVYTFDLDGNIAAFSVFPLDNVESIGQGDSEITVDAALNTLKKVKKEKLGLKEDLSHYTIIADEWTTVVNGVSCYCFNIFEGGKNGQLVAMYYVSTFGTGIYTFDEENGEFIQCN